MLVLYEGSVIHSLVDKRGCGMWTGFQSPCEPWTAGGQEEVLGSSAESPSNNVTIYLKQWTESRYTTGLTLEVYGKRRRGRTGGVAREGEEKGPPGQE